jgi:hypothetical protein
VMRASVRPACAATTRNGRCSAVLRGLRIVARKGARTVAVTFR